MRSALAVFVVAAVASAATYFMAATPVAAEDLPRTISVSGMGEVSARPDQANISLGVVSEGRTAQEALRANSAAMQGVFDQMDDLGIAEENIRTSNFSINPQYTPYRQGSNEPRRIIGYQVSNMVSVLFDDLEALGPGLDAIVGSGANQFHGISFSISETDKLQSDAREAAVANAIVRATTLASAAGVSLGRVLSINEGGYSTPQPMYMARSEMAMDSSVPIASGTQSISSSVSMVFEID